MDWVIERTKGTVSYANVNYTNRCRSTLVHLWKNLGEEDNFNFEVSLTKNVILIKWPVDLWPCDLRLEPTAAANFFFDFRYLFLRNRDPVFI